MNSVTNPLTFRQPSSCITSGEAEREPLRALPASQPTFFALGFSRLQFSAPQHAAGPLGESGSQSCANSCHNSRFKYLPLTQPSLQSKQRSKQQAPCRPPAGTLQAGKASSLGPTVDTAIYEGLAANSHPCHPRQLQNPIACQPRPSNCS